MNKLKNTLRQPLPEISTPQAKGSQTVDFIFYSTTKNETTKPSKSNVSFLRNDRTHIKQDQFYNSALLTNAQLAEAQRQSKKRRNEFYSQMLSENPYNYPEDLSKLPEKQPGVSEIALEFFKFDDKESINRILMETSCYADNLSQHSQRIKPQNFIPQRQDVIKLAQWLDVMIKKIVDDTNLTQDDQRLRLIEEIFNRSLKELVREISLDCLEKSVLLEKIWNQYIQFNVAVIKQMQIKQQLEEKEHLSQLALMHQTYQNAMSFLKEQLKQKSEQLEQLTLAFQRKRFKKQQMKNTYRALEKQVYNLENELADTKSDKLAALQEQERLMAHLKQLEKDYQNLSEQFHSKSQELKTNFKPKRLSTIVYDSTLKDNAKATSTIDLELDLGLIATVATNTEDPPVMISILMQTETVFQRTTAVQTNQDQSREPTLESMYSDPRSNDELKRLRERKQELEEQLRLENQANFELKKQKQMLLKDGESKTQKIQSQDQTIALQQKEIERLLNELNATRGEKKPMQMGIIGPEENGTDPLALGPMSRKESQTNQTKQPTPPQTSEQFVPSYQPSNQLKQVQSTITSKRNSDVNLIQPPEEKPQPSKRNNNQQPPEIKEAKKSTKTQAVRVNQRQVEQTQVQVKSNEPRESVKDIKKSTKRPLQNNKSQEQRQEAEQTLPEPPQQSSKQPKAQPQKTLNAPQPVQTRNRRSSQLSQVSQQSRPETKLPKDQAENHYIDAALEFVTKLAEQLQLSPETAEPQMPISNVLKLISQFYRERLTLHVPIYAICYEFYINTFGLKNIAESKMTIFCNTVFYYRQIPRIALFSKFLYINDRLSDEDLDFYILSLTQLDEQANPQNLLTCQPNQEFVAVSAKKALEQLAGLKDQAALIEGKIMKEAKQINGQQFLDLDYYFIEALEQFQLMRKIHKDNFKDLFAAVDVNEDNIINLEEFLILFNLVEGKVGTITYQELFKEELGRQQGLSFHQFGMFCMHHKLFTKEKQDLFSQTSNLEESVRGLQLNWNFLRKSVTERLKQSCQFSEYYQDLVRKLDESLKTNKNYTWLLWRILDEQSKEVFLEFQVTKLIGPQLNYIFHKYGSLQ